MADSASPRSGRLTHAVSPLRPEERLCCAGCDADNIQKRIHAGHQGAADVGPPAAVLKRRPHPPGCPRCDQQCITPCSLPCVWRASGHIWPANRRPRRFPAVRASSVCMACYRWQFVRAHASLQTHRGLQMGVHRKSRPGLGLTLLVARIWPCASLAASNEETARSRWHALC